MKLPQPDKDFLTFVLAETGKSNAINDVIAHLEKTNESVNAYLLKALANKYGGDREKAEKEVIRYRTDHDRRVKDHLEFIKKQAVESNQKKSEHAVEKSSNLRWVTIIFLILIGALLFWTYTWYFNKSRVYVIADNGVKIRSSKLIADTIKPLAVVPFGDYVKVIEVDSNSTWCTVQKNSVTGYVASYHFLGPLSELNSLDSIYSGFKKTPDNEQLNSTIKRAVYKYISDSNFVWCLKPVANLSSFTNRRHAVIELPKDLYGAVQFANGYDQPKYYLVLLRNRTRLDNNRAILFELSSVYEARIIATVNVENSSDCFLVQTSRWNYLICDFTNHHCFYEITNQDDKAGFKAVTMNKPI